MDINLSVKKSHDDGMPITSSSSAIEIPRVETDDSFRKRSSSVERHAPLSPLPPKRLNDLRVETTPQRKSSLSSSPLSPLSPHNLSIDDGELYNHEVNLRIPRKPKGKG